MIFHHERNLLAACLAAYFGYYWFSDPLLRGWIYYVGTGVLAAVAGYGWREYAKTWYGVAAASLMMSEGSQQAVCGLVTVGMDLTGRDLCKRALGEDFYTALVSLVCAGLMVLVWPIQQPRK